MLWVTAPSVIPVLAQGLFSAENQLSEICTEVLEMAVKREATRNPPVGQTQLCSVIFVCVTAFTVDSLSLHEHVFLL